MKNNKKCIKPDEIQEGDLVAYLHGDASTRVIEHIARCVHCAEQVEQLRMVDTQLLIAFYRDTCPTPRVLSDFVLKRLSDVERLRVAAHIRQCSICSREIAAARDLMREEPRSLLQQLRETLALALLARPVRQSATPVRGEGWQGRFEVENFIITLSSHSSGLTGRVRCRNTSDSVDVSGETWLLPTEQALDTDTPYHSEIDKQGRFHFADIAAGTYTLLLQIEEQNLALETIKVM